MMKQPDSQLPLAENLDQQTSLIRLRGQRFCTDAHPPTQRLEWLKEIIGREYANVDITPPKQMPLYNDMRIYPWQRGLRFSPIYSNAITLERLPKEPDNIAQDCYFAVLLIAGNYKLEQGGREVLLQPGEMSLYDATQPHRITIPASFSKVLISIPRPILDERFTNISRYTATKLSTRGSGAITATTIASTMTQLEQLNNDTFQALSDPILDLFSLSLAEMFGDNQVMTSHRGLVLLRIKRFIATHLNDSELNASTIAVAVGVSIRYINNLFSAENTSLMRYLTQQRLELSRHYLASPLYRHWNITRVAMQCGFNNMTHFSRIFHQTYGLSPRAYRQYSQHTH